MAANLATICYLGKHKFAMSNAYYCSMLENKNVRETLAANLDMLMHLRKPRWKQIELAKKAGVSQRTVGNMLAGSNKGRSGATLDRIDAVANVFGLQSWHLLMPGLPDDIQQAKIMSHVISGYLLADDDGRDLIVKIAERESRYNHQVNE